MSIKKTGAAADQVISGESAALAREAALSVPQDELQAWGDGDDQELAAENRAADRGDD